MTLHFRIKRRYKTITSILWLDFIEIVVYCFLHFSHLFVTPNSIWLQLKTTILTIVEQRQNDFMYQIKCEASIENDICFWDDFMKIIWLALEIGEVTHRAKKIDFAKARNPMQKCRFTSRWSLKTSMKSFYLYTNNFFPLYKCNSLPKKNLLSIA